MSLEKYPGFVLNLSADYLKDATHHFYCFKTFRLEVAERQLLNNDKPVSLTPKAFDVLALLVENGGHLVEKEKLLRQIWPDSFVEEGNITRIVHTLRRVLGEDDNGNKFIETVATKGYRFVAEVTEIDQRTNAPASVTPLLREVAEIPAALPQHQITQSGAHAIVDLAEWRDVEARSERPREPLTLVARESEVADTQTATHKAKLSRKMAIAVVAILLVASVAASYYFLNRAKDPFVFQAGEIRRLTTNGRVASAAFSPEGKFIVYAQKDSDDQQSLWMQRIASDNALQVAPPANIKYQGLQITPDGNTLYYIDGNKTLYQTGVLGGQVRKIADKVGRNRGQSKVAISPDGKEIATARRNEADKFVMVIMNADGSNERNLFTFEATLGMRTFSWSPDGKVIACQYSKIGPPGVMWHEGVMGIQAADGQHAPILAPTWSHIDDLVWLPDSQSLAIAGTSFTDQKEEVGPQIWQIPYPGGEQRRISMDSNSYLSLGIAADGLSTIALKTDENALIETVDDAGAAKSKGLTSGSEKQDGVLFMDWLRDGRIVFDSSASEKYSTLAMEPDGANKKQLTSGFLGRAISNDGNTLIFSKLDHDGMWSMDLRTGSERLLLPVRGAQMDFTPDDKWIVFSGFLQKFGLAKMPADGGEPTQLLEEWTESPVVSPDGKMVAFIGDGIGIISIDGGEIVKTFKVKPEVPESTGKPALRWTPDGRAIYYVELNNGVSNIWRQPIDGGPPVQITRFETGRIFNFVYSRDGKQLALSRGTVNSDVVLIKNSS